MPWLWGIPRLSPQRCCPSKCHHPGARAALSLPSGLQEVVPCVSCTHLCRWNPGLEPRPKGVLGPRCKGDQRLSPVLLLLGRASPCPGWLRRAVIPGEDAAGEGEGACSSLAALGSDGAVQERAGDQEHLYLLQPTWALLAGLLGPLCCPQPGAAPVLSAWPWEGISSPPGPRRALQNRNCCRGLGEQGWPPAPSGAQGTHLHVPSEPGGLRGPQEATVCYIPCSEQGAGSARSCRLQFRGKFFCPPTPAAEIHQPQHLLLFFAPAPLQPYWAVGRKRL